MIQFASYHIGGSKRSSKSNPAYMVISLLIGEGLNENKTVINPDQILITLKYEKAKGWYLPDDLNTSRAAYMFNTIFLHNRPIESVGFQKICDSNYKFADMLDKEMEMKRQHKWILS